MCLQIALFFYSFHAFLFAAINPVSVGLFSGSQMQQSKQYEMIMMKHSEQLRSEETRFKKKCNEMTLQNVRTHLKL